MTENLYNRHTDNFDLASLVDKVVGWHYNKNIILGTNPIDQSRKLKEEYEELVESLNNKANPIDDIGDMLVVMIAIAEQEGLSLQECLAHAWGDIKDRKGKIVDGLFVKEA